MSQLTPSEVRMFLKEYLERRLTADGRTAVEDLPDNCDLLLSGMVDSIGLLELVSALQQFAGRDIDFEILDPEQMTIVGPLCQFVADQVSNGNE
jgi:acyl carrier protein